jgi:D-lyxose ketol-isomerase
VAGGSVVLGAGESITLPPGLYHSFYSANGSALIGEVSSMNDDVADNRFYQALSRFPDIIEDELPFRLLATEYSRLSDFANPASVTRQI